MAATADRKARKNKVIETLNKARAMELFAIHQYMNQHYSLDDKDYGELAANVKLIAIDEMRHAEAFAERIKELGGEPTSDLASKIIKGQDVKAVFGIDADTEDDTIDEYNKFIKICQENGDVLSAKLLEGIIAEEQMHFTYFDNVNEHLKSLGDTYLSKVAGTTVDTGPSKGFALNNPSAAAN